MNYREDHRPVVRPESITAANGRRRRTNASNLVTMFREGTDHSSEMIVLLHGLGNNNSSFREIWESEALRPVSILAPDFAGFGKSRKPKVGSTTIEYHAQSISDLLEKPESRGRSLHIVGHGMGALPAMLLAEEQATKYGNVDSVTLVEGNLTNVNDGVYRFCKDSAETPLTELKRTVLPGKIRDLRDATSKGNVLWGQQLAVADADALQQTALSLLDWQQGRNLPQMFLDLPVARKTYILGKNGKQFTEGSSDLIEVFKRTPVEFLGISNGAHFVMTDNPDHFYRTLRRATQK